MADISEVLSKLEALATLAIYPTQPSVAGQSVLGFDVQLGTGWPGDEEIENTLQAGQALVSIYPIGGERNTTSYEFLDFDVPRRAPGISVVYDRETYAVSYSGVANSGDVIGVTTFGGVNYTIPLAAGLPAAAVQQLVNNTIQSTEQGLLFNNVPLLFNGVPLVVSGLNSAAITRIVVATNGYSMNNLNSIERRVQFTVWAFDQSSRDAVSKAITNMVGRNRQFIVTTTADEVVGMQYASSDFNDRPQNAGGYMRTVQVVVSFETTVYDPAYAVLFSVNNTVLKVN